VAPSHPIRLGIRKAPDFGSLGGSYPELSFVVQTGGFGLAYVTRAGLQQVSENAGSAKMSVDVIGRYCQRKLFI